MRDAVNFSRRQWLRVATSLSASACLGGFAAPANAATDKAHPALRLAAAWGSAAGHHLGILTQRMAAGQPQPLLHISSQLEVPTRAHGLLREPGGTVLAVARRPGDWLLRWQPDGKAVTWAWAEPDRAFTGHVIASADGKTLYTPEVNLETGQGLIGVRNAETLVKTAEWASHGMDPHELLLDRDGSLLVANGGIPTAAETGRTKTDMDRMDSSLVRLHPQTGELQGQWRLSDKRLSVRHMAWGNTLTGQQPDRRLLGIALQAEHDDDTTKAAAPVLALFDGQQLGMAVMPEHALQGYGGSIAFAAGHFAVGCPRANGVALWSAAGQWEKFVPLDEACAVVGDADRLWAGGRTTALELTQSDVLRASSHVVALPTMRLDNHWVGL